VVDEDAVFPRRADETAGHEGEVGVPLPDRAVRDPCCSVLAVRGLWSWSRGILITTADFRPADRWRSGSYPSGHPRLSRRTWSLGHGVRAHTRMLSGLRCDPVALACSAALASSLENVELVDVATELEVAQDTRQQQHQGTGMRSIRGAATMR